MIKILFLDGEQGSKLYQTLISEEYNIERFSSEKDLRRAVTVSKPQIVILHEFAPGLANKLLTKYPFVPVVVYTTSLVSPFRKADLPETAASISNETKW